MSTDPKHTSPQENAELEEARIEALFQSFEHIDSIQDEVEKELGIHRESKRLNFSASFYRRILKTHQHQKRRKGLVERSLRGILDWCESQTLFPLLEYVGKLAILIAIVSFISELSTQDLHRQRKLWELVTSPSSRTYDSNRQTALEELNSSCFSLEGLEMPKVFLEELRLDQCFRVPGGDLFGKGWPRLFGYQGASLRGADLRESILNGAALAHADLRHAQLGGVQLRRANLSKAQFQEAALQDSDFFRADLRGADFTRADLSGADLSHANLRGAKFSHAVLRGANLAFADLRDTVLEFAELNDTNLSRTDLSGSVMLQADLSNAQILKSTFDERSRFDDVNLEGAVLRGTKIDSLYQLGSARNFDEAMIPLLHLGKSENNSTKTRVALIVEDSQYFFDEVTRGAREVAEAMGAELIVKEIEQALPISNGLSLAPPAIPLQTVKKRENSLTVEFDSLSATPETDMNVRFEAERSFLEELIADEVDAVILAPHDLERSVEWIENAANKGIAISFFDHVLEEEQRERWAPASFTTDQFRLGFSAGEFLARQLKKEKTRRPHSIGVIKSCGFAGCFRRVQGFREALNVSNIPWKEEFYLVTSSLQEERKELEASIQAHPDVRWIWASNESGTGTAIEVLSTLDLQRDIRVIGTDDSPNLREKLNKESSPLIGLVAQDPYEMGRGATAAVLSQLRGNPPTFEVTLVDHLLIEHAKP